MKPNVNGNIIRAVLHRATTPSGDFGRPARPAGRPAPRRAPRARLAPRAGGGPVAGRDMLGMGWGLSAPGGQGTARHRGGDRDLQRTGEPETPRPSARRGTEAPENRDATGPGPAGRPAGPSARRKARDRSLQRASKWSAADRIAAKISFAH